MNLTPEQKEVGRHNYYEAMGVSRRDFFKGVIAAGAVSGGGLGAMYFGYQRVKDPVRVGVIGTGDEGNVLIGAVNPDYVQVVAIADIRPYNIHRAFHGDWSSDAAIAARPGLIARYGWKSEDEARRHVKVYDKDYHDLLNDKDVEAIIIALPLHLHAQVAIEALQGGKDVLTEKLMGHNVAQCKVMARVAEETGLYLATGHQRHYNVLYDNANHLIRWGILGELHYIRAQWHRGNLPGHDSWDQPLPGGEDALNGQHIDKIAADLQHFQDALKKESDPAKFDLLTKKVAQWKAWCEDVSLNPKDYGYQDDKEIFGDGRVRTAMAELCRWRLWERTGGGLMAELGSHQLDAASIFISSLRADGKEVHPLTVHAIGGRYVFPLDRQARDHVFCMLEFPSPGYQPGFSSGYKDVVDGVPNPKEGVPGFQQDPNKKIGVTYSSINGNGFGGYGEIVMGTKGTLVIEQEKEIMLYAGSSTTTKVGVKDDGGGPTMDTQASGEAGPVAQAGSQGPVSRGYTEEIEHWAWCIRNRAPENQPRCGPEVSLGDAVIALTANTAIKNANEGKGGYIPFQEEWFDVHQDATPDGSSVEKEHQDLVKT